MTWWIGLIFYSLICALGGGFILDSKNRSYFQGFMLGLAFGVLGLLITVGVAPQEAAPQRPAAAIAPVQVEPPREPMGLLATLSAVLMGALGGVAAIAGVVAFASWLA